MTMIEAATGADPAPSAEWFQRLAAVCLLHEIGNVLFQTVDMKHRLFPSLSFLSGQKIASKKAQGLRLQDIWERKDPLLDTDCFQLSQTRADGRWAPDERGLPQTF